MTVGIIGRISIFLAVCLMLAVAAVGIMFMVNGPFRELPIHPVTIVMYVIIIIIGAWKISGIDPDMNDTPAHV